MKSFNRKSRRSGRECAVQFLYGLDFTEYDWESALDDFWASMAWVPDDCAAVSEDARAYALQLIEGIMQHRDALDAEITGRWPIGRRNGWAVSSATSSGWRCLNCGTLRTSRKRWR